MFLTQLVFADSNEHLAVSFMPQVTYLVGRCGAVCRAQFAVCFALIIINLQKMSRLWSLHSNEMCTRLTRTSNV